MGDRNTGKPDYGVDAPHVLRNLFLIGVSCLLFGVFGPHHIHLGQADLLLRPTFFWTGSWLVLEALLFLFYVKFGRAWRQWKSHGHRYLVQRGHGWQLRSRDAPQSRA